MGGFSDFCYDLPAYSKNQLQPNQLFWSHTLRSSQKICSKVFFAEAFDRDLVIMIWFESFKMRLRFQVAAESLLELEWAWVLQKS